MTIKSKYRRNTPEEEAAIQRGIDADPDTYEPTDEQFAQMVPHQELLAKRRGRPKAERPKEPVNLRLDPEVLAFFRSGGAGWQTRLNATLAAYVARRIKRQSPGRKG